MNTIGLQYAVATFIIGLFVWGGIARIARDSKATKEDDKMSCLMVIVVSIISAIISYFISK
jgi:hypothetical protein